MNAKEHPQKSVTPDPQHHESTDVASQTALQVAKDMREIAEHLLGDTLRDDPKEALRLADRLRTLALSLEEAAAHAVVRADPVGPGGMGYIMALSDDEGDEIDWGSKAST
jgi:hypothetical protein